MYALASVSIKAQGTCLHKLTTSWLTTVGYSENSVEKRTG